MEVIWNQSTFFLSAVTMGFSYENYIPDLQKQERGKGKNTHL
jgi:hypothetical protein